MRNLLAYPVTPSVIDAAIEYQETAIPIIGGIVSYSLSLLKEFLAENQEELQKFLDKKKLD
jgi:hypothetical protein